MTMRIQNKTYYSDQTGCASDGAAACFCYFSQLPLDVIMQSDENTKIGIITVDIMSESCYNANNDTVSE
ncbi:MAG TPA: hypothetical protein DCG49_09825 [Ruminococcus sp.]|nr:hypothetical protein [Ruminococcus sp.]